MSQMVGLNADSTAEKPNKDMGKEAIYVSVTIKSLSNTGFRNRKESCSKKIKATAGYST